MARSLTAAIAAAGDGSGFLAEARPTLALAAPLILGQLFAMGTNVVDVMLAGHFSAHALGAVAIGASIWQLALMTMVGLMLALPPSIAQLDGAGRRDLVVPLFRDALLVALATGVALGIAVHRLGPALAVAIGTPPDLLPDVRGFLHGVAFAAPGVALYLACRGFSEGLSVTRPTMLVSGVAVLLLIPIGYALMHGAFGLPGLGARGLGIASTAVFWIEGLAYAAVVRLAPLYPGARWGGPWRVDPRAIAALLRLGVPMASSVLMEVGLFTGAGLIIGRLGDVAVAGHQIALNIAGFAFMVPLGMAAAITVRVGNAVGRDDPAAVRRAGLAGIVLVLFAQLCSCAIMLAVPGLIAALYTDDPKVAAVAAGLLLVAAVFQLSDGVQVAANGALRGVKDTRLPMLITAFAYWGVGMPLAWWLGFPRGMGATGVWIGFIAGLTVAAGLLSARFLWLTRAAAGRLGAA